jgi:serine/threonine protein kinase
MGVVWAARSTADGNLVAVKLMHEALRGDETSRRRVLRESIAATTVGHPNVVRALDVFEVEIPVGPLGKVVFPVLVMDLLYGETLAARLDKKGGLSVEETAAIFVPVVSAIGTAHARGVAHRDLKPENLFLVQRGDGTEEPRVLDFGIAKLKGADLLRTSFSHSGTRRGTPLYMAPEQLRADHKDYYGTDVWALGAILYECLSGSRPIEGTTLAEVVTRLVDGAITPLSAIALDAPPDVSRLVDAMLNRVPSGRPPLQEVFDVLCRHSPVRGLPFGRPESELSPVVARSDPSELGGPRAGSPLQESDEEPPPMARRFR